MRNTQDQILFGQSKLLLREPLLLLGHAQRSPAGRAPKRLRQLQIPVPAANLAVFIGCLSEGGSPILAAACASQRKRRQKSGPRLRHAFAGHAQRMIQRREGWDRAPAPCDKCPRVAREAYSRTQAPAPPASQPPTQISVHAWPPARSASRATGNIDQAPLPGADIGHYVHACAHRPCPSGHGTRCERAGQLDSHRVDRAEFLVIDRVRSRPNSTVPSI